MVAAVLSRLKVAVTRVAKPSNMSRFLEASSLLLLAGCKRPYVVLGQNGSTPFITADKYLCRLRTEVKGAGFEPGVYWLPRSMSFLTRILANVHDLPQLPVFRFFTSSPIFVTLPTSR